MLAGKRFATKSIAVDTNILGYAHRTDSPLHRRARAAIETLASGVREWTVPWPCAHEFFAVVTHPRIYKTATPAETDEHLPHLESLALPAQTRGGAIHDARIAAICVSHGVAELWSADRDFSRYPQIVVRNPLIG